MGNSGKDRAISQAEGPKIMGWLTAVLVIIVYLFLVIYVRGEPTGKALGRKKSCQSNLRVISGAHEMQRSSNDPQLEAVSLEDLLAASYLKSMPTCNGDVGKIGSGAYVIENGIWKCTFHGTIDEIEKEIQVSKSFSQIFQRGINRFSPGALIFIPIFVD